MSESLFVDTSALYALHDRDDHQHAAAARIWRSMLDVLADGDLRVVTHSAVIVETSALVQRRLGMAALRDLHHETLPVLEIVWVRADLHQRAVSALLAADRRDVSLVDWTSFELARDRGITRVFAFDDDFVVQGFVPVEP